MFGKVAIQGTEFNEIPEFVRIFDIYGLISKIDGACRIDHNVCENGI